VVVVGSTIFGYFLSIIFICFKCLRVTRRKSNQLEIGRVRLQLTVDEYYSSHSQTVSSTYLLLLISIYIGFAGNLNDVFERFECTHDFNSYHNIMFLIRYIVYIHFTFRCGFWKQFFFFFFTNAFLYRSVSYAPPCPVLSRSISDLCHVFCFVNTEDFENILILYYNYMQPYTTADVERIKFICKRPCTVFIFLCTSHKDHKNLVALVTFS
jgi:hypothetical protein